MQINCLQKFVLEYDNLLLGNTVHYYGNKVHGYKNKVNYCDDIELQFILTKEEKSLDAYI